MRCHLHQSKSIYCTKINVLIAPVWMFLVHYNKYNYRTRSRVRGHHCFLAQGQRNCSWVWRSVLQWLPVSACQRATGQTGGVQDEKSPYAFLALQRQRELEMVFQGKGKGQPLVFSVRCWWSSEELSYLLRASRYTTLRYSRPVRSPWRSGRGPPAAFSSGTGHSLDV